MRVLICDGLHRQGVKIFQKAKGIDVEVRDKIELEELLDVISDCEGLVVRSRPDPFQDGHALLGPLNAFFPLCRQFYIFDVIFH